MRKLIIILFTCPLFFTSSCQIKTNGAHQTKIPLDLSIQRPIIEITINGKGPYKFIFDTGSTGHVIDQGLVAEFGFSVIGQDTLRTPGSSNILLSPRYEVKQVAIPGSSMEKNTSMNSIDLRSILPVDGIISPAFFSEYLIALDYPNSSLTLSKGSLTAQQEGVIPYLQKPNVLNIYLEVDGISIETHLDTGNPGGFNLPYSMKDKLTFKEDPVEDGVISTPVATYKKWKAALVGDIKIGTVTYANPKVSLIEGFQFVNFGYQIFKDLRTTIDATNHLILFEKVAAKNASNKTVADIPGEKNEFTGWYGGQVRKVFIEDGVMYLQRNGSSKLKLEPLEKGLYQLTFSMPVRNELPKVQFQRDVTGQVSGMKFLFKDGKKELIQKDKE